MRKVKDAEYEEKETIEEKEDEEEIYVPRRGRPKTVVQEEPKKEDKRDYGVISQMNRNNDHDDAIIAVIVTLVICLLAAGLFYTFYLKDRLNNTETTTKIEKDVTITDKGIADAVEKVYDAVVVVETFVKEQAYGSGTGFVFKVEGDKAYIMTNHHVVANSTNFKVTFTNNKKVEATLVGSDEYSEIAVLSVNKDDIISVAEIGKSSEMRIGDTTFAVGAPIDSDLYSWSVTRGILSGKNRLVEVSSSTGRGSFILEVLQTDTAINSGNSGGPLCNSNGEVIGITNMKLASSTIEGMAFAVPIDDAVDYAASIISGKGIERPYLGVALSDTSYSNNRRSNSSSWWFFDFGNQEEVKTGVFVQTVEKGSAAEKAGIEVGDNIKKINDVEVSDVSHFKYELYKYNIGDKIKITVERDGKEKVLEAKLASNLQTN